MNIEYIASLYSKLTWKKPAILKDYLCLILKTTNENLLFLKLLALL